MTPEAPPDYLEPDWSEVSYPPDPKDWKSYMEADTIAVWRKFSPSERLMLARQAQMIIQLKKAWP